MEKYVIIDTTNNTGKLYITFTGENTELLENAEIFEYLIDCLKAIQDAGWESWAEPKKLKNC